MPHWNAIPHPDGVTRDEFLTLLRLRKETLDAAVWRDGGRIPLPAVERWGWTCHLRIQGRAADGSLMAHLVAEGPRGEIPYVRKVRLVKNNVLPFSSGRG